MLPAKTGDWSQRLSGEMVNFPDPISHILQSSQSHVGFRELWGEWIAQQVPDYLLFPCGFGLDGLCIPKSCPLAHVPQQPPNQCSPLPHEHCNPSMGVHLACSSKTPDLHPKPLQSHALRCSILPTHSSQVPGCPFSRLRRREIIWKNVF